MFSTATPFPAQRYRLAFHADAPLHFPHFPGPALRSSLGTVLRQTLCITGAPKCDGCEVISQCLWPRLFETSAFPGETLSGPDLSGWALAPRLPFGEQPADDRFEIALVLIGPARAHLPLFLRSLTAALARLAKRRITLEQLSLPASDGAPIAIQRGRPVPHRQELPPPPPEPHAQALRLDFDVPLRLGHDGEERPLAEWQPRHLMISVLRRIEQILADHCGQPLEVRLPLPDLSALDGLELDATALRLCVVRHRSVAQQRTFTLKGYLGPLWLRGDKALLDLLWPWLWLGQHLQIGKFTRAGFGSYRLSPS